MSIGPDGRVRLRRATREGWPALFDRVLDYTLSAESLRELSIRMHRVGFHELPTLIEDPSASNGLFCWLRLRSFGRVHAVMARSTSTDRFERVLSELASVLPVGCELESPSGAPHEAASRPSGIPAAPVADLERAVRFHEEELARDPKRTDLHLDLFALHLARGDRVSARREALALRGDTHLAALVDDLLRRL